MTVPEILARHFQRRVVIGMTRIEAFYNQFPWLPNSDSVALFRAVDARKCLPPKHWDDLPAMWGCTESHKQVICRALCEDVESILIMEDDCRFVWNAAETIAAFMDEVPKDWDGLMLGGQVSVKEGKTTRLSEHVSRCDAQVERLHCYALSRRGMQIFHDILAEPTSTPNDYRWGDAQEDGRLKVYRCEPFCAYQAEGQSSISGRVEANRVWDDRVNVRLRDPLNIPVVSLVCPFNVMEKLRDAAIISNGGESPPYMGKIVPGRVEQGELEIAELMLQTSREDPARLEEIAWALRCDTAFHRSAVFVFWHPSEVVQFKDSRVIRAETVEDAKNQLVRL